MSVDLARAWLLGRCLVGQKKWAEVRAGGMVKIGYTPTVALASDSGGPRETIFEFSIRPHGDLGEHALFGRPAGEIEWTMLDGPWLATHVPERPA